MSSSVYFVLESEIFFVSYGYYWPNIKYFYQHHILFFKKKAVSNDVVSLFFNFLLENGCIFFFQNVGIKDVKKQLFISSVSMATSWLCFK